MMAADLADCVWTDPPYGVEYVGKTKDALTIQNDGAAGLGALLAGAFATIATICRAGAPVYVAHADTGRVTFETAMRNAGISVRQNLVWVKGSIVMGHSDFHYRHEPILYGFTSITKGLGRLGRGGPHWFGGNNQSTVFEVPQPTASRDHPTMKPTELIERMIRVSCRPGGIVFDGFGGSGSTLIAAQRVGRQARVVELDPVYADVICRRWEMYSGQPATRDGEPFPADPAPGRGP